MNQQARLVGLSGEYGGNIFPITGEKTLIGRGEDCDLQIVDSRISRNHAQLRLDSQTWVLEDLGSTHGTFVKGERVEQAVLRHGDTITIGETILRFEDPSTQDAIPTEMASADATPTLLDPADAISPERASPDDIATVMQTAGEEAGSAAVEEVAAVISSPDDIATVMQIAGEGAGSEVDQVATVMASPEEVPTRLASPENLVADSQGEPARSDQQAGEISPPTAVAGPGPSIAPPKPKKPFPWKWVAIAGGGLAIILVVGFGLIFLGRILEGRDESVPAAPADPDDAVVLTIEAAARQTGGTTPLIPPTLTPTLESEAVGEANPGIPTGTQAPTDEPPISTVGGLGGAVQLAFASDRSGRPQIYLIDLNTQVESQLTDLPGGACQPSWSADGSRLAYTSPCNTNREEYSGSSIFLLEVDPEGNPGSAVQLITTIGGGDYDPAWSRDGNRIAFTSWRTGRPQIFIVNPDGTDLRNLNDDLAYNWAPTWSMDGSQLAFLTGRGGQEEIWIVPAGGGEERRFSRSDGKDVARPGWSPDGSTIVFEKIVGNIPRLIAAPVVDGGVRELQVCQEGQLSLQPMGEPTWSPDGAWLAFETWPDGVNHEIGLMRASCTEYRLITTADSLEFDAAWRPAP